MGKLTWEFLRWWICTKIAPPNFVCVPIAVHKRNTFRERVHLEAIRDSRGEYYVVPTGECSR